MCDGMPARSSLQEFLAATINQNKLEREDHLKAAFQHFDLDGNGTITHDELTQVRLVSACVLTPSQCVTDLMRSVG
jgi:Ca2+-binding EF-hand superfamily protein